MASASIPAQPGETIAGKYLIERVLGTGGVGMVVAARHLTLGQVFAIKFLLPNAAHDENDVRRFMREAQSAVQLKNEHVARVIDIAELDDGSPYIVLEYLEGHDLGGLLRTSGPLSTVDAVGYVLQVCEAVAEAHSIGMVHRDLKPSNFFLTFRRDGSSLVKVLDFGIAKYRIELEQQDVRLTQTRALLGSPVYMSPEQVRSARSVDPRSDIWSLGVSLFELLTDTVPFGGETVTGVAAAVTSDPVPPIARHRPDVPVSLATVIEKCLAKRPEDRYQSIAEFAEALVPFGPPESILSLQRITGVLGFTRTENTTLRDSARAGVAVSGTHLTQVATTLPTVRRSRARSLQVLFGLGTLFAVSLAAIIFVGRLRSSIVSVASTPSANSVTSPEPVDANVKPVNGNTVELASAAPAVLIAPASSSGAVEPTTPAAVTATHKTQTNKYVQYPARTDPTNKTKTTKKTFVGGSIEDIVDTRH
jgi:serine/threonine-protein kinase